MSDAFIYFVILICQWVNCLLKFLLFDLFLTNTLKVFYFDLPFFMNLNLYLTFHLLVLITAHLRTETMTCVWFFFFFKHPLWEKPKGWPCGFFFFKPGVPQDNYKALWFEQREDPMTGESMHIYKGGYWEAKEHGDWHGCPDIFWISTVCTPVYRVDYSNNNKGKKCIKSACLLSSCWKTGCLSGLPHLSFLRKIATFTLPLHLKQEIPKGHTVLVTPPTAVWFPVLLSSLSVLTLLREWTCLPQGRGL